MYRFVGCLAAAVFLSNAAALASPVYVVAAPVRPPDASDLHTTAGIFIDYALVADPVTHTVGERLTLWDATTARDEVFSVGPAATLDGLPISCDNERAQTNSTIFQYIQAEHMCSNLPKALQPGTTWITLVYWNAPKPKNDLQVRDTYRGTDEIHTILTTPSVCNSRGKACTRPLRSRHSEAAARSRTFVLQCGSYGRRNSPSRRATHP